MSRKLRAFPLFVAVCAVAAVAAGASVAYAGGGNSDAAHACQQGGYLNLHRGDGTGFKSAGACISYAAGGGAFSNGLPSCVVNSAANTGCLVFDDVSLEAYSGDTATINAAFSFDSASYCNWVLFLPNFCSVQFPNAYALGGGTYTIRDASGNVVQSGSLAVNPAMDPTTPVGGLVRADYASDTDDEVGTDCAAADYRAVAVGTGTDPSGPTVVLAGATVTSEDSSTVIFQAGGEQFYVSGPMGGTGLTIGC